MTTFKSCFSAKTKSNAAKWRKHKGRPQVLISLICMNVFNFLKRHFYLLLLTIGLWYSSSSSSWYHYYYYHYINYYLLLLLILYLSLLLLLSFKFIIIIIIEFRENNEVSFAFAFLTVLLPKPLSALCLASQQALHVHGDMARNKRD